MIVKTSTSLLTIILLMVCLTKGMTQNDVSTSVPDDSGCIREQARSVVSKNVYPNAVFRLNDDHHTGTDKIDLKNGERLMIRYWGCEYYVLTFQFETSRFQADTTDVLFWVGKGYQLMTEVEKGIDSPQVTQGIEGLKTFLKAPKKLRLGEEILFSSGEIRNYATVDRIQKLDGKKYRIEISFLSGPY
jgi:hypothetical protein